MPVHQYVYLSTAKVLFREEALLRLLGHARDSNAAVGITGLLLHSGEHFLQLLEGDKDAVYAVVAKIHKDPRHGEFLRLIDRPADDRIFPDWSMGLASMAEISPEHQAEFSSFIADVRAGKITGSPTDRSPIKLLRQFAKSVGT